jgi:hypothetical protein
MNLRFVRFVIPFLFVRNWHTGAWEISPVRAILVSGLLFLLVSGFLIAYELQKPIEYVRDSL